MARKFAAVVFSMGCIHASSTLAMGLGELSLESFLNEPLKAKVDLLNTDGLHEDQIRIRLATKDDFKKMGLDRAYFLTNIKFEVDIDASGRGRIIMTSEDPVLEPYLDFIVEARWPSGRLLREYTVLVDPPVFDSTNPVISASERVETVEGIPPASKKKSVAASSGTRVEVKKSDLPPGAMPSRDFAGDAAAQPVPGGRYLINRNDTLWKIASRARPEGVSVHQAMLDIQRMNPNAFIDGNINRIKAGYVLYLPDSGEISSDNVSAAVAEVQQQNEDWREGVASQSEASSGPSLRISSDPVDSEQPEAVPGDDGVASASGVAAMEDMEKAELERVEMEQRLSAMSQQVETLERIVNLKDDQIAALQKALAEGVDPAEAGPDATQAGADALTAAGTLDSTADGSTDGGAAAESEALDAAGAVEETAPETAGTEVQPETGTQPETSAPAQPVTEPQPAAPAPSADADGGLMGYLKYIVGAAVAALLAVFFVRRRRQDDEEESVPNVEAEAPVEDVFANVELQEQELEVDDTEVLAPELEIEEAEELTQLDEVFDEEHRTSRGYGERKHDEYASDVDTGDALAEADIYIAYGRYPQALDLLRNALANDPRNPAYRLKLVQIYAEMDDREAAMGQFEELEAIGDVETLSRAQEVLAGMGAVPRAEQESVLADSAFEAPAFDEADLTLDSDLTLETELTDLAIDDDLTIDSDLTIHDDLTIDDDLTLEKDLTRDTGEALVDDFAGLEIEVPGGEETVADELDLSADFEAAESDLNREEEDLVIAAETNGFSTKLDLARAYLDMGDEDGARQILQEIVAEGSEELKAEAQALIARID